MPYLRPTLFGLAYATRLFRQLDYQSSYEAFRAAASPLDLTNQDHVTLLRDWLNKWGCRIKKDKAPAEFSRPLADWSRRWTPRLPSQHLRNLSDPEIALLGDAYWDLRNSALGPAAAAKTLFALRPETAIPWDELIRVGLDFKDNRAGYPGMLRRSREELHRLVLDASHFGITESDIPAQIGSPGRTLARLLDEYHWITLTQGCEIPSGDDLKHWLVWAQPTMRPIEP
jgi:hypothetical protein